MAWAACSSSAVRLVRCLAARSSISWRYALSLRVVDVSHGRQRLLANWYLTWCRGMLLRRYHDEGKERQGLFKRVARACPNLSAVPLSSRHSSKTLYFCLFLVTVRVLLEMCVHHPLTSQTRRPCGRGGRGSCIMEPFGNFFDGSIRQTPLQTVQQCTTYTTSNTRIGPPEHS